MKTLEYYMGLPYRLEMVPDEAEGGCVASYPELRGCLTVGDSAESAAANAEDAKREWLTAAIAGQLRDPGAAASRDIIKDRMHIRSFSSLIHFPLSTSA